MQQGRAGLFIALVSVLLCRSDVRAQQDCFNAISVCSSSYVQNNSFSGVGLQQEVPPGSTCLGNGEVNSVWYTFTTANNGTLEFQLTPLNSNDDYDFALYNLTNDSCSGIASGLLQPVSCNYSADPGATGISSSGTGNNNGSSDANQNQPVNVLAGETYALLISNFTSSQSGYALDFSGTVSIADNQAAIPDSVSNRGICNPENIYLFFDEGLDCSSISGDGSEITISGPSGVTVTGVFGVGCNQGFTDQIRIRLANKIQVPGTYTISIGTGSDGDSFTDGCGNQVLPSTVFQFEVEYIGPDIDVINVVPSTCGQEDGQAEVQISSGTAPFTYSWNTSPAQTTAIATGLTPGTYRVTVYDANGCLERATVVIQNNSPIDLSALTVTSVTCNGASDGSAELIPNGGSPPYTIVWDTDPPQTGQMATALPGGEIEVSVTDNTGCEHILEVDVPEPAPINISIDIVNPDCGMADGTATVNASGGAGGFAYAWNTNPPQSTAMASGLAAGVYTVQVTDQNGCQASGTAILTNNFAPNASIESRIPDCGQGVGQATAVATSGTAPYSYSWNTVPPQNTATATGLSEGDYFVTVTDANGCVQIINVKIDTVPPPELALSATQPSCGMADGQIEASVANGIAPFTFTWSSSANTSSVETDLAQGTYTVSVTDSIGCVDTETIELIQQEPESEIVMNDACLGEQTTFSFVSNSGATSWVWDFGDGTTSTDSQPVHTYGTADAYTVTLMLTGGCMPDQVIDTVSVFAPPTADFIIDPEIPTTRDNILFLSTGNGGVAFYWDFGDGTTGQDPRPLHLYGLEGTYDVQLIVTDANGCTDTVVRPVEVLLQPAIYLPNAFIPEGASPNNRFKGYGIGVTDAELAVFDRWGTLVYFSDDLNNILMNGWDGRFNGELAPQGVYAYKVKAWFYNNTFFERLGTVTLIR